MVEGISEVFWHEKVIGKTPLIEGNCATFYWKGNEKTKNVFLYSGITGDLPLELSRIGSSLYFSLSLELPPNLRTLYTFLINYDPQAVPDVSQMNQLEKVIALSNHFRDLIQPDPNNRCRQVVYDGDSQFYSVKSVLEMPDAEPQPWCHIHPYTPVGHLKEHWISSTILNQKRRVWIYTPNPYRPDKEHGFLLAYDGQCHQMPGIPLPTILDNLIHARKIPPMIGILIDSVGFQSRNADFITNNTKYLQHIEEEVIPFVKSQYPLSSNPQRNVVTGESAAGFFSTYTALKLPQIFGNVLCNSGTFIISELMCADVIKQLIRSNTRKTRIYMTNGTYEDKKLMLSYNQDIYTLLVKHNYDVTYTLYNGEHDFVCWQGEIAKGLCHLV